MFGVKTLFSEIIQTSISEESITNYCACALTAIIDEGKDIRESGYTCAQKNFN